MVSYKKSQGGRKIKNSKTAMNISKPCHMNRKCILYTWRNQKSYNQGFSPIILIPFNAPPRCHMNSLKGESEKASTYPMLGKICKKGRYLRETGLAGVNRI
jgi:hypothetical protein